jgi:hypothetical protein
LRRLAQRRLEVGIDGGIQQRNERNLDAALRKLAVEQRRAVRLHHAKIDFRILPPQPLHDGLPEAREQRFGAADPQLARRRIRHELDLVHARSEIVENGDAALEQGAAIRGRLDALRAAVEQAHGEHAFEVGYHLGNDRLRDREMLGRLRHAAPFRDGHDDLQVLKLDAVADEVRLHFRRLFLKAIAV